MVEKEQVELDVDGLRQLIIGGAAKRGANGEWTLHLALKGDYSLDDNRLLPIDRTVKIKTRQQGRKPNPARNWGKGGGFRKKETK